MFEDLSVGRLHRISIFPRNQHELLPPKPSQINERNATAGVQCCALALKREDHRWESQKPAFRWMLGKRFTTWGLVEAADTPAGPGRPLWREVVRRDGEQKANMVKCPSTLTNCGLARDSSRATPVIHNREGFCKRFTIDHEVCPVYGDCSASGSGIGRSLWNLRWHLLSEWASLM